MRQEFSLPMYGWKVVVWYLDGEKEPDYPAIEEELHSIGCKDAKLRHAMSFICDDAPNTGLTYSNLSRHRSVMVIGHTTSARECANTLVHERKHLEYNICQAFGIDPFSEEAAYLAGRIAAKMYEQAKTLLCEDCRKNYLSAAE